MTSLLTSLWPSSAVGSTLSTMMSPTGTKCSAAGLPDVSFSIRLMTYVLIDFDISHVFSNLLFMMWICVFLGRSWSQDQGEGLSFHRGRLGIRSGAFTFCDQDKGIASCATFTHYTLKVIFIVGYITPATSEVLNNPPVALALGERKTGNTWSKAFLISVDTILTLHVSGIFKTHLQWFYCCISLYYSFLKRDLSNRITSESRASARFSFPSTGRSIGPHGQASNPQNYSTFLLIDIKVFLRCV